MTAATRFSRLQAPVMARTNTHVDDVAVAQRIKQLRTSLGMSQRELQVPGVSYAYISRIESGTRTPSLSALVLLAAQFRDQAQSMLDNYEPIQHDDADDFVAYVEWLRFVAVDATALFLMTGDAHHPCLLCGRHEHGGHDNGSNGNGSTRRRT